MKLTNEDSLLPLFSSSQGDAFMESDFKEELRWNLLQLRVQERRIVRAFQVFRSNGIEPILFKGWAAARYYPEMTERRLGDIDISVSRNEYSEAKLLTRSNELNSILIDLHNEFRTLDTADWSDVFRHSELVELFGSLVRVPRREDHLRILATHWLTDGGRFKEKLWDIYYAVESRPPTFDWHRCLDTVRPNRRVWIICTIALAHRYLSLDVEDLPFADQVRHVPTWIIRCIEREWENPDSLEPVLTTVRDRKRLFRQIKRRLPPNPIRATIEADGDLYGSRRWLYQAAVLGRRAGPFVRGSFSMLRNSLRNSPK